MDTTITATEMVCEVERNGTLMQTPSICMIFALLCYARGCLFAEEKVFEG